MRVFIAGIDGYLGWALAQHLVQRGHEVAGADGLLRRQWVQEMGSISALPIATLDDRVRALTEHSGREVRIWQGDLRDYDFVEGMFRQFQPEAVIHFGECPSAPYSMIDREHTVFVQMNNIQTTFNLMFAINTVTPAAHLVKLGTMGEYGTPNVDIPEGFFEIEYRGRTDRLPFPRQASSWYHWSKVHGSNNIMFACKIWGLRATDVMQGVVFGTRIDAMGDDERMLTRLDFDQAFGTAINRFACQAVIEHPLTPYGRGGQRRGFLPLRDSIQCLTLALDHPPAAGDYRVFNQFEEVYNVTELAGKVQRVAAEMGLDVPVRSLENPRAPVELHDHHYAPCHERLFELGYQPTHDVEAEVRIMLADLYRYRGRIAERREVLIPDVHWDGRRERVAFLSAPELSGR